MRQLPHFRTHRFSQLRTSQEIPFVRAATSTIPPTTPNDRRNGPKERNQEYDLPLAEQLCGIFCEYGRPPAERTTFHEIVPHQQRCPFCYTMNPSLTISAAKPSGKANAAAKAALRGVRTLPV